MGTTEKDLRARVKEVLYAYDNLSVFSLAASDPNLARKLNNQINGETAISASTILLISERFPDVSSEWLLRGEGEMMRKGNAGTINKASSNHGNANAGGTQIINDQSALIAEKDARIADLQADKANLMQIITAITHTHA